MTINDDNNTGATGDHDEEESPSSRLGGDTATEAADKGDTSSEVRRAAIGEREPEDLTGR
jgi:hypothetical protein